MAPYMKPLKLSIEHCSIGDSKKDGSLFLELEKDCICCMLPCCNRPTLNVYNVEKGYREAIGKILLPC